jgi:hypothetical protein
MGSPWRSNKFSQRRGLHRLGHAGGAIVRLNNGRRPPKKSAQRKKRRTLKTGAGTGIYEAKEKPTKPAFILLTCEFHSGLKWVEVD